MAKSSARSTGCLALLALGFSGCCLEVSAFRAGAGLHVLRGQQDCDSRSVSSSGASGRRVPTRMSSADADAAPAPAAIVENGVRRVGRGEFLRNSAALILAGGGVLATTRSEPAGAIGDLYEFKDQARFAQHATIQVPDMDAAVKFWTDGVGMQVLRKRSSSQSDTTVVGFGPEALEQPPVFRPGVSSFLEYGGHFSLELNEQKGGNAGGVDDEEMFYDPGNGLQCLQIAVDSYRISTVIKAGGIVESGYGWLQLVTPGGLRVKLMSGMRRDPPMFMMIKVKDLNRSIQWYTDVAGMSKMPYPRARAVGSPFEPDQPKKSVFMAYEGEAFGVVLVPATREEVLVPGSIFSLSVLAEGVDGIAAALGVPVYGNAEKGQKRFVPVFDPDGYALTFVEFSDWRKELPPFEKKS